MTERPDSERLEKLDEDIEDLKRKAAEAKVDDPEAPKFIRSGEKGDEPADDAQGML